MVMRGLAKRVSWKEAGLHTWRNITTDACLMVVGRRKVLPPVSIRKP